jgi:hypothetical protein
MKLVQEVFSVNLRTEYMVWAVPWLRQLVACLSSQKLGFNPRPLCCDLWWTKWHWNGPSPVLRFSAVNAIQAMPHTYSSMYRS